MNDKRQKIVSICVFAVLITLMVVLTIVFWPYISSLSEEENRIAFKEKLDSFGIGGWFIMVGIQVAQVVIAFLPGEPIEILMGVLYGPWVGMLTTMVGILIGTLIIYFLAKKIGKPFIRLFVSDEDFKKFKFLNNPTKIELTTFILFFIPGTPKDVLTYIVPLTPINPKKFFLISVFARIPSIITSTLIGDSLMEGNLTLTIVVFAITAIISVAGIIINNKYVAKKQKEELEK